MCRLVWFANVLFCALAFSIFIFLSFYLKFSVVKLSAVSFFTMNANGFGLRAGGHFEAQNCQFTIKFISCNTLQITTNRPLAFSPCYKLAFCLWLLFCPLFTAVLVRWLGGSFAFFVWLCELAKKQMCHQKRWVNNTSLKCFG